jgi:predicted GIY-YIG superfamily endonuclease
MQNCDSKSAALKREIEIKQLGKKAKEELCLENGIILPKT